MNLAIFDVDGTLVRGPVDDDALYVHAIRSHIALDRISTEWAEYRYSTDSGVLFEIFTRHLGQPPSEREASLIRQTYTALLAEEVTCGDYAPEEIPGASSILAFLSASGEWMPAVATGSWRESTMIKLQRAGILVGGIPMAFAEDHFERTKIIELAIERACEIYQCRKFGAIVYVGDRAWDYRASQALGLGFVALAGDARLADLVPAELVLRDFAEPSLVLRTFQSASSQVTKT